MISSLVGVEAVVVMYMEVLSGVPVCCWAEPAAVPTAETAADDDKDTSTSGLGNKWIQQLL